MIPRTGWVVPILMVCGLVCRTQGVEGDSAFLTRNFHPSTGAMLPYRLLLPVPMDSAREYPCIVFLHGAIARGSDNEEPLNWGPRLLRENGQTNHASFFLIVPQCPKTLGWTSLPGGKGVDALSMTVDLLTNQLAKEFKLDARRRYLTGVSMGGIGLWGFMSQHPGVFAAGIPVCAAGTPSQVTREAARFPMWVFHSDDDHLIPVQSARDMVAAWKAHGGEAKYTEYTGLKHSSWKKAYLEPDLLRWLFQQKLLSQ